EQALPIFGVRIGNDLVLFQRGIGLAVIQQILGEPADCIQIVTIKFNCFPVGTDSVLVLLLLLVGVSEGRIQLRRTRRIGDGAQDLRGAFGIALFVVQVS